MAERAKTQADGERRMDSSSTMREHELGQILYLYSAPTQDSRVLLSEPGFNVRVLCQKHEGPAERIGCGLMTCCHKRHDFITHLLIAHALARLFIPRLQKHGQQ